MTWNFVYIVKNPKIWIYSRKYAFFKRPNNVCRIMAGLWENDQSSGRKAVV